jgi:hypothetical protein
MFSKGRPRSIVPIDFKLANGLSVVPEVPTPMTAGFQQPGTELYNEKRARPISQVTEIDEALSEFEEDEESEETISNEFVSTAKYKMEYLLIMSPSKKRLRGEQVKQPSLPGKRFPLQYRSEDLLFLMLE